MCVSRAQLFKTVFVSVRVLVSRFTHVLPLDIITTSLNIISILFVSVILRYHWIKYIDITVFIKLLT